MKNRKEPTIQIINKPQSDKVENIQSNIKLENINAIKPESKNPIKVTINLIPEKNKQQNTKKIIEDYLDSKSTYKNIIYNCRRSSDPILQRDDKRYVNNIT